MKSPVLFTGLFVFIVLTVLEAYVKIPPMTQNIALIGFMGAGKTVVANQLARKLKRKLVSTDALIIEKDGRLITDIFKESGEPFFRKLEKDVVKEVSGLSGVVIDCGGGVVLDQSNIQNLKKTGVLIYLYASPDVIYGRVKDQAHRPLLNVEKPMEVIKSLFKVRDPFYRQADHIVDTCEKSIEGVIQEILRLIQND